MRNLFFGGWGNRPSVRRAKQSRRKSLGSRHLALEVLEQRQLLSISAQPEVMYYLKPITSGDGMGTAPIVSSAGDYVGGGTAGTINGNAYSVVLDESAVSGQTVKLELYASVFGTDSDPTNDAFLKGALDILNRPDATPLTGKPSQIALLPEFKEYGYSKGKVQGDINADGGVDLGGPINVTAAPNNTGAWVIPCAMDNPVFGSDLNGNGWTDIRLGTFTFTISDTPTSGASTQLWAQPVINSGLDPVHTFVADTTGEIGSNGGDVRWGPSVTVLMAGEVDSGTDTTGGTDVTSTEPITDDSDPFADLLAKFTPDPHPTGDRPSGSGRSVVLAAYTPAPILDHGIPELVPFVEHVREIQADILSNPDARPSYWGEVLAIGGGEYRLHFNDNGMRTLEWTIDWGDGSQLEKVPNQPWVIHQYPGGAGQYEIKVTASSLNGTFTSGAGGSTGGALSQDFSATSGSMTDSLRGGGVGMDWVEPIGGNGGQTVTNFTAPPGFDQASAIALDNGNILVVGTTDDAHFGLVRYLDQPGSPNDGELDTSFGTGGLVSTPFGNDVATGVAVAVDGNTSTIVMAGTVLKSEYEQVALARYDDDDGGLDGDFGSGGLVTDDLGSGWEGTAAVAVLSDGTILVAGSMNGDFVLLHYDSDGMRDTNFGSVTGGIVIANFSGTDEMATAMALDGNGNVLIAGTSNQTATGKDFALARFSTSGVFDSAFGLVTMDFVGGDDEASSIAIQPSDGKIVLAGSSNDGTGYVTFALARFDTEGNPDGSFGPGGSLPAGAATTDFGDGNDRISGVQVQYDGRIVVSGSTLLDGSGTVGTVPHFAVARYNPDGTPDDSFGPGGTLPAGTVTTDFVALGITLEIDFISESSCGIILDTTGRLVVAGTATADDFSSFAVACYDPGELTLNVEAANVPPVLRVVGDQQAAVGQTLELSELGVFIHAPVTGSFTYEIDWGDGAAPDSGTASTVLQGSARVGTLGGQHTYTASGTYYVAATITDPDGGSDTQTLSITVEANARPLPILVAPGGLSTADVSAGGVRFAGGEVVLAADDLGLGTTRSYTNQWQSQGADDLGTGLGWQLDESPYVVRTADGAAVVFGAQRSLWFTESGSNYAAKFGAKELLSHDAENHLFTLVGTDGTIWQFDDFSFFGPRMGQFRAMVTPGGQAVEVTGWAFDGRIAEMQWRASAAAVPYEMRLYLYLREGANAGRLESVEVWRNEANDAPAWQRVRKATYAYYESGEFEYNGVTGDLKTATLQFFGLDGSGYDWLGDQTTYYRYYTSGAEAGLLKMVVSAEGAFQAQSHSVEPATALDSSLLPYSSRYYEYNSSRRVSEATIGGDYTYTYQYADSPATDGYNTWEHKTTEERPDGSSYTVYTNFLGQVLLTDLEDQDANHWYTYREYGTGASDKGLLHRQAMPSAIATAAEGASAGAFDIDFTGIGDDAGLVYHYTYYATGAVGYLEYEQVQEGWNGTAVNLTKYEYTTHTGGDVTVHPVSVVSTYPTPVVSISTSYSYEWFDDSVQVKERKTTLPAVSENRNGSGVSATRFERFTADGNLEWAADERERFTHYEYDDVTGLLTQTVEDVDAGSSHTPPTFTMLDWPSLPADGDGLNLETDYQYDTLGRVTQVLGPAHTSLLTADGEEAEVRTAAWTRYFDADRTVWAAAGCATLDESDQIASWTLFNPVSITKYDLNGRATDEIQAVSGSNPYIDGTRLDDLDAAAFPTSSYTRHATHQYNAAGQLTADGIFTNLTTGQEVYSQSDYGYDLTGRLCRVKTPGEVITESFFDARGLTMVVWVGSNDQMTTDYNGDGAMDFRDFRQWIADHPTAAAGPAGTNLVPVASCVYDQGNAGGDGNLTSLVQHVDAATDRTTSYGYDERDRLQWTLVDEGPLAGDRQTYTLNYYCNMGRLIKVDRYLDADDNGVGGNDLLIGRTEFGFDSLGRTFQTTSYEVHSDGTTGATLTDNYWYDATGNLIKSQAGGTQQFTKTKYDGLGRPIAVYVGYDVDEPIGTTGTLTQALTPDGDTIFEQADYAYNDAGETLLVTARQRLPGATGEGPLGNSTARTSYVGYWFDALGRQIATADYGALATAPTRDDTVPARSDTLLVTTVAYNARGEAYSTFNADGRETRTYYDAAGRAKTVIENYQVDEYGYPITGLDKNITTDYAYNPMPLLSQTSVTTVSGTQVTKYVYGTDIGDTSPDVYRNDLVRAVIYADSSNAFNPITRTISGSYDRVEYTYNRLGEVTSVKDQNGTVHEYEFDGLGRQVQDRVTTPGTGIDGTVRRIETVYNVTGQVERVTSYDDPDVGEGNVVNDVYRRYNGFGQLTAEYQKHSGGAIVVDGSGDVTDGTPCVAYQYATAADGLRPTAIVYPNGRHVRFEYGDGTADDYLNRVQQIRDEDNSVLAEYTYLGLGSIVGVELTEPGIVSDLLHQNQSGQYDRIDQFNRVVDAVWSQGGASVDDFKYGYDRLNNRQWKENVKSTGRDLDELYAYDEVYRLIGAQRGNLVSGAIQDSTFAQQWDLDGLGNWAGFNEGTAVGTWTLEQTRAANSANEIDTNNDHSDTGDAISSLNSTPNWADPVYDAVGNMTSLPKPDAVTASYTCTFDAWNRLVKVEDGLNTLAEYEYDGLHRRIERVAGSETRHYYLSAAGQVLEERVNTSSPADQQYVWGLRYVDELILRDRDTEAGGDLGGDGNPNNGTTGLDERLYALQDANWNVTTLVGYEDSQWQPVQRFLYDPYGTSHVLNDNFTDKTGGDEYQWGYRFTGQELDLVIGVHLYDSRLYAQHLGVFITHDIIRAANAYQYVKGSPLNYTDPSGMLPAGTWVWDPCAGRMRNEVFEAAKAELQRLARSRPYRPRQAPRPVGFCAGYLYDVRAEYRALDRFLDQRLGQVGVLACGGGWVDPQHASASRMIRSGARGLEDGALIVSSNLQLGLNEELNAYVDKRIKQQGGWYKGADVAGKVGTAAAYGAFAVWGWAALGLPTWGCGVGPGHPYGVHFIFGSSTRGAATQWMQSAGGGLCGNGWIVGAGTETVGSMWFTVEGVPILFPTAAVSNSGAWNCFTAAAHSLFTGWTGL